MMKVEQLEKLAARIAACAILGLAMWAYLPDAMPAARAGLPKDMQPISIEDEYDPMSGFEGGGGGDQGNYDDTNCQANVQNPGP